MRDPRQRPRVLIVDDEPANLQVMVRALRRDFEILAASNGEEAQKLIGHAEGSVVDVVVTDQRMPGQNGVQFLRWLTERQPDARRLIVTAYADTEVMLEAINELGIDRILLKPFEPAELVRTVQELAMRDLESTNALAHENARSRIRQELLEERSSVLLRRTMAMERATQKRAGQLAPQRQSVDLLTGVGLPAGLREWLARELNRASSRNMVAVVAADVDDLETLNASRGPDAGDAAIIDLADALSFAVGEGGFVARMRGGKFIAGISDRGKGTALEVAEQARRRYATLTEDNAARAPHTASLGVAVLPTDAANAEELLLKADVALYSAKAGGKNRAVAY